MCTLPARRETRDHLELPATLIVAIPYATTTDALEIWQVKSAGDATTFAPDEASAMVWHAEFATDPATAAAFLQQQARALAAIREALPVANRRQQKFVTSALAIETGGTMAFLPEQRFGPERVLAVWFETIRGQPGAFSGGSFLFNWSEWREEAQGFLEQVGRSMSYAAYVETRIPGQLLARTTVSWLGDVKTVSVAGLSREWVEVHQRLVALSLESRAAWLQLVLHLVSGATILGVLAPTANATLALPVAWRFIRAFIADVRRLGLLNYST